jgi:putative transposase
VEIQSASSAVYELAYHIVWCPKYRKNLPEAVQRSLKVCIRSIAEARGWEVKELEVMPDHIHLFIGKVLKGTTGVVMFREHPKLKLTFRHGHLWSPSYYVGSVGHVSEETVARYVRDQKLRVPGRPKGGRASSPLQVVGLPPADPS